MKLTIANARSCLGRLCTRVQDPRAFVVLTRHGTPVAALVSIDELRRIWHLQDEEDQGPMNPLSGKRGRSQLPGFVPGLNGTAVTPHEAAFQMREVQLTRKAERDMLAAGGLDPIDGGEIIVSRPQPPRWRWPWAWRRPSQGL